MKRDRHISTRVTPWELKLIQGKAKRAGMGKSEFMRRAALDKPVILIEGLDKFHADLNRIGNNINQLTVILRTRDIQHADFGALKIDFGRLVEMVSETLRQGNSNGDYQDGERKVG